MYKYIYIRIYSLTYRIVTELHLLISDCVMNANYFTFKIYKIFNKFSHFLPNMCHAISTGFSSVFNLCPVPPHSVLIRFLSRFIPRFACFQLRLSLKTLVRSKFLLRGSLFWNCSRAILTSYRSFSAQWTKRSFSPQAPFVFLLRK